MKKVNKTKQVAARVEPKKKGAWMKEAKREHKTLSSVMRELLEKWGK